MPTLEQQLHLAVQHHVSGRLSLAEQIYQEILDSDPRQPVALHHLGLILHQAGKDETAVDLIGRSVAVKPDYAEAHNNLGNVFSDLGRLSEAVPCYRKALAIKPDYAEAHYNLGNAFRVLGRMDEALASYRKALSARPDYAEAHNNLGTVLVELGQLKEAAASFLASVAIQPRFADALNNLGNVHREMGLLDEARASHERALAADPEYAEAHFGLGIAFQKQGRLNEAVASHRSAIALRPDYAEAHNNLGVTFKGLGRLKEAHASLRTALSIKPDYAYALNNLGLLFTDIGQLDDAVSAFRKALALKADYAEGYNNLGNALKLLGDLDAAVECYNSALAVRPDYASAYSNLVFLESYRPGVSLEKLKSAHTRWENRFGRPLRKEWRDHENSPNPDKALRIGFVSPDLGFHPVGFFVVGFFKFRRKGDIELICYSDREPDEQTRRLMALSDEWVDARGLSDEALSRRIHADRIDILVDLAGHTANNRLLVFARRPAPIQVTWAGYVGSTGLSAMDYLIADNQHVPQGVDSYYSEKIIRLPESYICYEPPDYAPAVGPPPFRRNGYVTFGCFNNPAKINTGVLSAWTEILKSVPESRLFLKYTNMNSDKNVKRISNFFSENGVSASRIRIENSSPHLELLACYNDVDIALDTFPYSGGLTTCEALWMGVPVITLAGETFASRHSFGHLRNVGLQDLVSGNWPGFVSKAVELARDARRFIALRNGLRERVAESRLCDRKRFAEDFAAAMRQIWKEWCSGRR